MKLRNNKKGFIKIMMLIILGFILFSVIAIGLAGMIKEVGEDYMLKPAVDIGQDFYEEGQISNEINENVKYTYQTWLDFDWNPDLFFLAMLITAISLTIFAAIKSRKMGWWSFSGYITIGSMGFLFLASIVINITQQFYDLFFNQLLERWTYSTPIFSWFMTNAGWFTFLWFVALILINQIEFGTGDINLNKEDFFDE